MGEAVLSSEEEVMETKTIESKKDGMVKWERFLPRMALRVLLVEADDSTRQIISALLRKSNYSVTAVADGLKAWEILRGRPHQIELILTEVDLPSISGYALLTLIMEHEICKNIPVIMMSSQDSVSTVYKCMLRGAADYLVKPLRRNELKNLWQHVWRRQSSTISGNVPQDESVGQQKIEATSENDAASNRSSGCMADNQRNEEYMEKGSDDQSSCTKPDFEAETHVEDMQDLPRQSWGKSLGNDVKMLMQAACLSYGHNTVMHDSEAGGSEVAACKDAKTRANLDEDVERESQRDVTPTHEACSVQVNSTREAIDFIGAFNNQRSSTNYCTNKNDSSPQLDLSLRRSDPISSCFENQDSEQKFTLRHSHSSAFARYTNKPLQPLHSTVSSVCSQQKEVGTDAEKNLSNIGATHDSDAPIATLSTQRSFSSLAASQSKQSEPETSCAQQRVYPVPVPVKGVRLNNLCNGYGSVLPHVFGTQSGLSPLPSPSSANQQEPTFRVNRMHYINVENSNCSQLYDRLGENAINSTRDLGHISPTTDQSANSSFCNGALSRLSSIGYGSTCGSNSNVDQVGAGRAAAESKNEEGLCPSNGNSHRSVEREAALTKFRLKRKDRCYEKKVRYESRKKLAEQRPRVKGQFVRHVNPDPTPAESENQYGET